MQLVNDPESAATEFAERMVFLSVPHAVSLIPNKLSDGYFQKAALVILGQMSS